LQSTGSTPFNCTSLSKVIFTRLSEVVSLPYHTALVSGTANFGVVFAQQGEGIVHACCNGGWYPSTSRRIQKARLM